MEAATMKTIRVLALGDSLTAGFNLPHDAAFPVRLEKALRAAGHPVEIVNAGVSGDTSAGGKARMDWLMRDPYDAAIVELGANDGLRGIDPERTFANLNTILVRLQDRGIPTLLAGMLAPPNYGAEYGAAFKDVYRRLARKHDVVFYEFFLDGVAADPVMNQGDGIHPTERGVNVIVERMLPHVV
ncbi:MAG: arylesterase, partial [Alphaproteobacteria bacterium]|nr:arylesterase [Alphaproteobacteria bacterium]